MKQDISQVIVTTLLTAISFLLGGFDLLIVALWVLMACDWFTGVLKALKKQKFSLLVSLWGIANKLVALIVVSASKFVQEGLGIEIPIRDTVISMLIVNEFLSVLKNSSAFVKGLEPLAKYFENVKINVLRIFTIKE